MRDEAAKNKEGTNGIVITSSRSGYPATGSAVLATDSVVFQ